MPRQALEATTILTIRELVLRAAGRAPNSFAHEIFLVHAIAAACARVTPVPAGADRRFAAPPAAGVV